jgi:hypothetical protein
MGTQMKTHTFFYTLAALALVLAAVAPVTIAAEPTHVVEGRLTQITTTLVTVDNDRTYAIDSETTECFDFRSDRTTCGTLALIGYADKARVTLVGTLVKRIDLLVLQQ